ncbi:MAG: YbjQ family protein [Prochlorococcaceae cyanobacterium]
MRDPIVVTTTFTVEGSSIRDYKGLVRGIVVRSPTLVQGFLGSLKQIIGGRIGAYTEMCEQTREAAYNQMVEHALLLGANAIVGVRYDGSDVSSGSAGATEVLCYGTAVVVEPLEPAAVAGSSRYLPG